MKGKPKFKLDEQVSFLIHDYDGLERIYKGAIKIIDSYGTIDNDFSDVSYDILAEDKDGEVFIKHVPENLVTNGVN